MSFVDWFYTQYSVDRRRVQFDTPETERIMLCFDFYLLLNLLLKLILYSSIKSFYIVQNNLAIPWFTIQLLINFKWITNLVSKTARQCQFSLWNCRMMKIWKSSKFWNFKIVIEFENVRNFVILLISQTITVPEYVSHCHYNS